MCPCIKFINDIRAVVCPSIRLSVRSFVYSFICSQHICETAQMECYFKNYFKIKLLNLKKIKNRQKRAFTRSALLFTVRVTHFCHFREKPTSMQLFLGKESLQLMEMLKNSKHICTDNIELKIMPK